jgi:hypothetical protein
MKLKVTREFRSHLSEKLMDLGNLVGAGLIIGQFVNSKEISITLLLIGFVIMGLCYIISFIVST